MLTMLGSRAAKLTELKTCKPKDLEKKIQAVLDQNHLMVKNILGGATKINEDEDYDEEESEGEDGEENGKQKGTINEGDDEDDKHENENRGELVISDEQREAMLNEKRIELMTPQSAFVTFRNPFAAFLAKKMMKIIKKNKIPEEKKPKLFDKNINFGKMGYPSDTQYLNFGVSNIERMTNFVMIAILVYIWAYTFFYSMFTLYQMM